MSEQIVLPGFSGDVVLVNGLCYEFAGYTIQPSEDLDVLARFETCDECGLGVPAVPISSAFSSSGSSIPEPVRCNDCDPQLADTYTIALGGLEDPWGGSPVNWNGSHTAVWDAVHPFVGYSFNECGWEVLPIPENAPAMASKGLSWDIVDNIWRVRVFAYTGAWLYWEGPTDPCDPRGSYGTHVECAHGAVVDGGMCVDQGATTCTVS